MPSGCPEVFLLLVLDDAQVLTLVATGFSRFRFACAQQNREKGREMPGGGRFRSYLSLERGLKGLMKPSKPSTLTIRLHF